MAVMLKVAMKRFYSKLFMSLNKSIDANQIGNDYPSRTKQKALH